MIFPSSTQPYAMLIFLCGGMAAYMLYEIIRIIRLNNKLLVLAEVVDGIWAVFVGLFFIGITHFLYQGVIKYFTIFTYLLGMAVARLIIKKPIRKISYKIFNWYKSKIIIDTKDIKKEDTIMADAKKQKEKNKVENKKNQKQNQKQNKPE